MSPRVLRDGRPDGTDSIGLSLTKQAFVVHINGHEASFYYTEFPQNYLRSVHRDGIDGLTGTKQIYLHHTKPQNLLLTAQRSKFIDDFVALILFLADGRGNVGFMRRAPAGQRSRRAGSVSSQASHRSNINSAMAAGCVRNTTRGSITPIKRCVLPCRPQRIQSPF